MHIGMNPCMNMSQMMGGGPAAGTGAGPASAAAKKDPLQMKTDLLRLTAFNNISAVYAKKGNWEECKQKCTRVLGHDDKNTKALFRRAKAYRNLGLYELARADFKKLQELIKTPMPAVTNELKLLARDEKSADKEFYAQMKKQMLIAKKKRLNKKRKKQLRVKEEVIAAQEAELQASNKAGKSNLIALDDTNENLTQNTEDTEFVWDAPVEEDGDDNSNNNSNNNSNSNQNSSSDVNMKQESATTITDNANDNSTETTAKTEASDVTEATIIPNKTETEAEAAAQPESVQTTSTADTQPTMF
jgi:hypothetical protein